MTGRWIASVARAVIRPHTYERTVAAALADVQHERTKSEYGRLRAYGALWSAVAGAVAIDLADDVRLAFVGDASARAWHVAAHVFGALFLLNLFSAWRLLGDVGDLGFDGLTMVFAWSLPSIAAPCLPALLIPVAVVLTRRLESATRPVLVSALLVASMFAIVSVVLVTPSDRIASQYRQAAYWRARMDPAVPSRSLDAIRRELTVPLTNQAQRRARADHNRFLTHNILARSAGAFAFALIGIGFAHKRGWRAFAWYATAYGVWMLLILIAMFTYERSFFPERPTGFIPWTRTAALFAVGTLALLMARRDARRV